MLLVGITAIVSAATFPETLPASPSNMASALEHRLVSGEGMIYPGSDAEGRPAPVPALLDGTWPDAFLDRMRAAHPEVLTSLGEGKMDDDAAAVIEKEAADICAHLGGTQQ